MYGIGTTLQLGDAFTSNSATNSSVSNGTFNTAGYNFTVFGFSYTSSSTRTIAFGSSTWTITGSSISFTATSATNLTVTGAATGKISMTSASAKTINPGAASGNYGQWPTLDQGGAGALTIVTPVGGAAFYNITNSYSATGATTITFQSTNITTVSNFTATGASGKVLTINSSTSGTAAKLVLSGGGQVSTSDYLSIKDSNASPALTWYAGANSTNVSGNTGWIFTAAPTTSGSGNFLMFM